MSTYKKTIGTNVRNNAGNLTGSEDQIFYDSTNLDFKYQFPNVSTAWRTGNNLNTARRQGAGSGIQTAALVFGGNANPGNLGVTELYDGVSFSEVNDLNTGRSLYGGGTGTSTASLAFSGYVGSDRNETESWIGSCWT